MELGYNFINSRRWGRYARLLIGWVQSKFKELHVLFLSPKHAHTLIAHGYVMPWLIDIRCCYNMWCFSRELAGSHFYNDSRYYTGNLQPPSIVPILKCNNEKCPSDNCSVLSILLFIASLINLHLSPISHSCKIFKSSSFLLVNVLQFYLKYK